jgi:drug/metabolite transporter (DMT)-like permease
VTRPPVFKLVISLVAGLITFGFAAILVRYANADPIAVVMVRTVGAFLVLLPFYWTRPASQRTPFSGKDGFLFALAGICLGLHFTLWTASLSFTSVASASVLVCIHPIILIIAERLIFKFRFATGVWLGVVTAFAGSAMLGLTDQTSSIGSNPVLGNTMAFLAAAAFVVYILIGQELRKKAGWLEYIFPVYTWSAVFCVVIFIAAGFPMGEGTSFWIASLALAFGPQLIGHGAMNYAVKYIQPTMLSMSILVEPILATIAAIILFSEIPPVASVVAMVIIAGGLIVAWFSRLRQITNSQKA